MSGSNKYQKVIGIKNSIYDELKKLKFELSTYDNMLSFSDVLEILIEQQKNEQK